MKVYRKTTFVFAMVCSINIWGQNSLGLSGFWNVSEKATALLNYFENNPSNYLLLKDWGLSVTSGIEFSEPASSNIYLISLSKRLGNNILTARYTPGFEKEFNFSTGNSILFEDSSSQPLVSKYTYKEIFGFGYSYKFSPAFNIGLSLRYFTQKISNEAFKPVLSGDTLFYIDREIAIENANFWSGDIGFNYFINKRLSLSIASINLFNFEEQSISQENEPYKIRTDKSALFRLSFQPLEQLSLNLIYEANNSFQLGMNQIFDISNSKLGFSLTTMHNKYQFPFLNGLSGALSFSNDLWGISISGVKYLSSRNKAYSFSEFKEEGINNLMNNKYSCDKAFITFSLTLNTIQDKLVKFLWVDVEREIYPTFSDAYVDSPFAFGRVVNLTDNNVLIKPLCKIEGIIEYYVQSPQVTIRPRDTLLIPFYAILHDYYNKQKAEISQAYFSLMTLNDEPDDNIQAPVLINGVNGWDGKVRNLRYFIKKDIEYSMKFSKNILSKNKPIIDTISYSLSPLYKAKYIFDELVKELVYVSDPRASAEYVQFPNETIKLRGGDCDDLSVCYSSLLESVGIETALVDYKNVDGIRHVNILFNTNLTPANAKLITENDTKYFIRKNENSEDEIWIPIETTSLTNFDSAWEIGADRFYNEAIKNFGLAAGNIEITDVY